MSKRNLEKTILVKIQKNNAKFIPIDIVEKISKKYDEEKVTVANLLKDLVSKGKVSINLNWKLKFNG